jgi:tRNA nucleotidyltransferase (CCA-adding enzyme)
MMNEEEEKQMQIDRITSSLGLRLIPSEQVISRKTTTKPRLRMVTLTDSEELKRFAETTINNRIEFCQKYKTGEEEIGKCVYESVRRFIILSRKPASRAISKKQASAIKKTFEEMKKEGKIKCQETL